MRALPPWPDRAYVRRICALCVAAFAAIVFLARAADGTAIPPAACGSLSPALHPVSNTLLHGTEETTNACQGRGNLCRERGNVCHG